MNTLTIRSADSPATVAVTRLQHGYELCFRGEEGTLTTHKRILSAKLPNHQAALLAENLSVKPQDRSDLILEADGDDDLQVTCCTVKGKIHLGCYAVHPAPATTIITFPEAETALLSAMLFAPPTIMPSVSPEPPVFGL